MSFGLSFMLGQWVYFYFHSQKETFEGLSQEALSVCIKTLKFASSQIASKTVIMYACHSMSIDLHLKIWYIIKFETTTPFRVSCIRLALSHPSSGFASLIELFLEIYLGPLVLLNGMHWFIFEYNLTGKEC